MSKVSPVTIQKTKREAYEELLRSVFMKMHIGEKGVEFLFDLLTPSERLMFARRIEIANRLLLGQSFLRIKRDLKVGLDTIQSVHDWLEKKCEDYRAIVTPKLCDILEEKKKDTVKVKELHRNKQKRTRRRPPPYACNFIELCKHYPSYGGFFSLLFEE